MIIKKKTWPEYFEKLRSGEKKYDLRIADFEVSPGDTIIFEEFDPVISSYTGRKLQKRSLSWVKPRTGIFLSRQTSINTAT